MRIKEVAGYQYIANDGTVFDTKEKCIEYEDALSGFKLFDVKNQLFSNQLLSKKSDDYEFLDNLFMKTYSFIIDTEAAYNFLNYYFDIKHSIRDNFKFHTLYVWNEVEGIYQTKKQFDIFMKKTQLNQTMEAFHILD